MQLTQKHRENWVKNWARIRQRGRTRYIWWNGVLRVGVPTGVLWTVTMAALQDWARQPIVLALALICFPIGGVFYGMQAWKIKENEYHQALQNSQSAMTET